MDYSGLRKEMVNVQIATRGIKNRAVLQAMGEVPRDIFVPREFLNEAYSDYPLPIGYRQTISQPYTVALMTELLQLESHHRVLEIGTGCGYQTAVLAKIAAQVYSVEIVPQLAALAKKNLQALNYHNIIYKQGDGLESWKNEAPFDRIIVAAAPRYLPQGLVKQLRVGGYMIIPIGSGSQILYCIYRKSENEIVQKSISQVAFVPMLGKVQQAFK